MKRVLPVCALLLAVSAAVAEGQAGERQGGFRLGYSGGLYYQHTASAGNAESGALFLASFRNGGFQATGMKVTYEYAFESISPDFRIIWGYGGHVGFAVTDHISSMGEDYYYPDDRFLPLIGADGYAGIEYRIPSIPLALSLNFKPFIEMVAPAFFRFVPFDFGFSIAYVF